MKPPIFVFEHETLEIFESLPAAELYLEAPDVGDLVIFDSEGKLAKANVVEDRVPVFWGASTTRSRVVLGEDCGSSDAARLKELLVSALCSVNREGNDPLSDLHELVQSAVDVFGYTR